MSIDPQHVANVFAEMADLIEIKGGSEFRIRAFRRVAQVLEDLPDPLEQMLSDKTLQEIPGIGKGTISRIEEILKTGSCADHQQLRSELPPGVLEMLQVPQMGPKTVKLVHQELGISSVDELEAAAHAGQLAELPRMGAKSQTRLLNAIAAYRRRRGRCPLGQALPQAEALAALLRALPEAKRVDIAGSTRRAKETIGDIDLLVTGDEVAPIMDAFVGAPVVAELLLRGDTKCSVRLDSGLQVDLRVIPAESYGAALHYFTGSQMHNIAIRDRAKRSGMRINEYGVFREPSGERLGGASEEEIFAAVGLPYIPPELREDRGEIEAAENQQLPQLISTADLRGDLHCPVNGVSSAELETLVDVAIGRGWQYLALTPRFGVGGLDSQAFARYLNAAKVVREKSQALRLLIGAEVTITADGQIDISADLRQALDWITATLDVEASAANPTERICQALADPSIDALVYPTGRVLGTSDGNGADIEAVLQAALANNVAIGISGDPLRLDLDASHCRRARDLGVRLLVSASAHNAQTLAQIDYALLTARRGWLEPDHVLNCQAIEQLLKPR
ncbi:MAG: DNA polymerase III [Deltaproteobacteria bacterium]|nr:DNA polymerase III [Deltaproteobacteria bacterium]